MRLRKYAVVKYHWTEENPVIHIHALLGEYHWVALDAEHVFLTAYYAPGDHTTLDSHPDVLLLPSLQTTVPVEQHATDRGKGHLFAPLRGHGLTETHTAHDIVRWATEKFGARFEPEI